MQLTISHRGPLPADASAEMSNRGFHLLFMNPSSGAYMDAANPADQMQKTSSKLSYLLKKSMQVCFFFVLRSGSESQHMNLAVKARPYPAGRCLHEKKNKSPAAVFLFPLWTPNLRPEPVV